MGVARISSIARLQAPRREAGRPGPARLARRGCGTSRRPRGLPPPGPAARSHPRPRPAPSRRPPPTARPPGPSRHWLRNAGRQHPVADLVGNRKTPRPVRADQHRNLDGPSRTEARRLQHPQHRAFPLDRLAPKKCPQHPDILSHLRPSHRPLPEHHPAGETRPHPDSHPTRGQLGQPGDRRRPSCHLHRDSDVTSAGA
jgi:hypothetical protein